MIQYNSLEIEGKTKISPSSFCSFYENPNHWFETQIKKNNTFKGNTATVLGTLIHYRLECLWKKEPIDEDEELRYLALYENVADVNEWDVTDKLKSIWSTLERDFKQLPIPDYIEEPIVYEIPNSEYHISGTFDFRFKDGVLGDIKTVSQSVKNIKVSHRIQLLIYALALKMSQGVDVSSIRVIYIVKTKTPKLIVLEEPITDGDIDWIKQEIKNMIQRLELCKNDESMIELMFPNNPTSYL
jgi:hypothetical protein